mgnify:CR=1 FL=1
MTTTRVIDFEQFAIERGASALSAARPELDGRALGPGGRRSPKTVDAAIESFNKQSASIIIRRDELRLEYEDLVACGDIRPPTRREHLERIADGCPEREDVQAARRILASRYGIEREAAK